jgi:hypothetical protein
MNESFLDERQERIQKALNEAKKREIEEKYGARFSDAQSELPPEVEAQWLNYITEFELQFENAKRISIRERLGSPSFRSLDEIPPEELEAEIDRVLDLLSGIDVAVDSLAEVSDEDFYRFLTTELINEEIDDIKIEGMRHCFIYDEFHPNDEYDAKSGAEDFLWSLFGRYQEHATRAFSEDEVYDPLGGRTTRTAMQDAIRSFYDSYVAFTDNKFECTGCFLEGEYARVTLQGKWSGLMAGSLEPASHKGECVLRMKKSPYGGYDLIQANIPGFITESAGGENPQR